MSHCYKTHDNKYVQSPPRMSDARHFTDYRPHSELQEKLMKDNNMDNTQVFRAMMINNANKLMNLNVKQAELKNGVMKCKDPIVDDNKNLLL